MNLSLCDLLPSPVLPLSLCPRYSSVPCSITQYCAVQCTAQFILQQLAVRKLFSQLSFFMFQVFKSKETIRK